jgi:hypothetical protein
MGLGRKMINQCLREYSLGGIFQKINRKDKFSAKRSFSTHCPTDFESGTCRFTLLGLA